jgi:hypothetical protein
MMITLLRLSTQPLRCRWVDEFFAEPSGFRGSVWVKVAYFSQNRATEVFRHFSRILLMNV